jgi:hypothetical protein
MGGDEVMPPDDMRFPLMVTAAFVFLVGILFGLIGSYILASL